jgi:hypothetical protein
MKEVAFTIATIAKNHMHVEHLHTRNSDRLDFHSVSVANLKAALEAAFAAGREYERTNTNS